jgi:hypothetical protein
VLIEIVTLGAFPFQGLVKGLWYIYGLGWRIQFGVKWSDIPRLFGREEKR